MDVIEVKWFVDENGKKYLRSDGIDSSIIINEENKEIQNAKSFFREIIYQSFLNDWDKKIVIVNDPGIEVGEVRPIIEELIEICNEEISSQNNA